MTRMLTIVLSASASVIGGDHRQSCTAIYLSLSCSSNSTRRLRRPLPLLLQPPTLLLVLGLGKECRGARPPPVSKYTSHPIT